MLTPLILMYTTLATPGLSAAVSSRTLDGVPRALYAADATGDGLLDGLVVIDRRGRRRVVVLDGVGLAGGLDGVPPKIIDVPDDAAFFGVCPGFSSGLLVARPDRLERITPGGSVEQVTLLADALPFAERGDLVLVDMCPEGTRAGQLLVPTIGGVARIERGGEPQRLRVPRRTYLTTGLSYRGPRARRDFSLMTTLVHPQLFAGDVDGDGAVDLAAAVEEELVLYLARGDSAEQLLPVRSPKQRRDREGTIDTRLVDLTGDGLLDAVVCFLRGGSDAMRTTWKVFPSPLTEGGGTPIVVTRRGLATPLLIADVDLDGRPEVVEPHVDTGIISMGKALVTGGITVAYRVHRFAGGAHVESEPIEVAHEVDFGRTTNIAGHPPLLGGDFNGDGRGDFVALGSSAEVALHLGRSADPPFTTTPALTVKVPSTQRAVSLRQGDRGPAVLLFLDEHKGDARVTAVVVTADARSRDSDAPSERKRSR